MAPGDYLFLMRPGVKGVPIIPIKKPSARLDVLIGAAEQNLLKLFQAIIEGTVSSPIVSEQNETKANLIIY